MNRRLLKAMREKLAEIERANGGVLRPEDVVREARKKTSVLHRMFEWDDKRAADRFRLQQARELIASVRYVYTVEEVRYSAPRYVRDPRADSREQGYVDVERIRSDDDLTREALCNEFARAAAHLRRAHELARALGVDESEAAWIESQVGAIRERTSIYDEARTTQQ